MAAVVEHNETIEKSYAPMKRSKSSTPKNNNNPDEKRGRPKVDTWFQLLDEKNNCIFCGHNYEQHMALRMMVQKPEKKNRISIGLYHLKCTTCAKGKQTNQAVCYRMSDEMIASIKEAGYQVC